jgi:hypothetical protein
MKRHPDGLTITFKSTALGPDQHAKVLSGPGGSFLSNEVSYRVLRGIQQSTSPDAPLSFHVHTPGEPIPQDTSTPQAAKKKAEATSSATKLRARTIETLKRIIAATGKVVLDRRTAKAGKK